MDDYEKVQAKYDYQAAENATQELSMSRGDVLTLLDDSKTWWKVKNKSGRVGYVPSNYIVRSGGGVQKDAKQKKPSSKQPVIHKTPVSVPRVSGRVKQLSKKLNKRLRRKEPSTGDKEKQCIALYNYDKKRDDELQLYKGQRILILEESEDDWWRGRNMENGQDGWFPSNYVELAPDQPQQQQQQPAVETENVLAPYDDNSPILENVRCLYDFKAKTGEELSFRENDELHILGKVENDPEWWVGRDRDGRIGLVPRIYTERVEPEPVPQAGPYEEMKLKNWFFDTCETREQAEYELRHGREGDFIVRPSESGRGQNPGALSISVKGKNKNKHFKVTRDETNHFVIGQRKFTSVDDLISNYMKNPIFSNGDEKLYLVRPLPKWARKNFKTTLNVKLPSGEKHTLFFCLRLPTTVQKNYAIIFFLNNFFEIFFHPSKSSDTKSSPYKTKLYT